MFGRTSILVFGIEGGQGVVSIGAVGDRDRYSIDSSLQQGTCGIVRSEVLASLGASLLSMKDGWWIGRRPGSQLTLSLMSDV